MTKEEEVKQNAPVAAEGNRDNNRPQRGGDNRGDRNNNPRRRQGGRNDRNDANNEWQEKVIQIRRVTKVVKGGKNMSFCALVLVGDGRGHVGVGQGKAGEVIDAIRKAIESAKKNIIRIPFDQGSIPHNVMGKCNSSEVSLFRAKKGTGLIAALMVKAAFELAGLHNIVCKIQGSTNPANVLDAVIDAIKKIKTRGQVRHIRGLKRTAEEVAEAAVAG